VPATAAFPGIAGQAYKAWIEPIAKFPANNPGVYRIHSTGTANGFAARAVEVDLQATKQTVPLGIVANKIAGGGNVTLTNESLFSTGCVYSRSKLTMTGIDAAYGIPAGVHTSDFITDSNGTAQSCPGTNKQIHTPTSRCDSRWPYDQDSVGGSLVGTPCASTQTLYPTFYAPGDLDGNGSTDVNGSYVRDQPALQQLYGFKKPPLSAAELEILRSVAVSQGNFHTKATGWVSPVQRQAVMYFDLTKDDPGGLVDLNDFVGFGRTPGLSATDAGCTDRSLIIVIEGGNARLSSNQSLVASVFLMSTAPNGQLVRANGNSSFIGTIYADSLDFTGTASFSMDECFMSNLSTGLLKLTQTSYREVDR
jgi:hypothetical protein